MSNLSDKTQGLLHKYNLQAKKSLGQNFLIDDLVLKNIVLAAELDKNDLIVEIGPGLGTLTQELCQCAKKVIAVEFDDELFNLLNKEFIDTKNLAIVNENALTFNPNQCLSDTENYKLIANIPYYLTGKILRHFLLEVPRPTHIVFLIQKEVAQRICAKAGDHSLPSLLVQNFGTPKITSLAPSKSFFPVPKVDSAILQIKMHDKPIITGAEVWLKFAEQIFRTRRKTLQNALHFFGAKEKILLLLQKANIDPQRRAQTLNLEEWQGLLLAKESFS
ncbi:MAG: 16S rRNA (adenine(1518)-N(6)/adenine(1519)-N(6))-dimethyltransferase RsmA [Patescibacteria group bacterium]|nr:16S rRNA (adenine(1518)-N(6)/adenine(1519)-N(6))-dimethyltransferase RsmA [Patescibacteria group bacterium]